MEPDKIKHEEFTYNLAKELSIGCKNKTVKFIAAGIAFISVSLKEPYDLLTGYGKFEIADIKANFRGAKRFYKEK